MRDKLATNLIHYDIINVHLCGPPLVQAREKARRYAGTRLAKYAVDWLEAGQLKGAVKVKSVACA